MVKVLTLAEVEALAASGAYGGQRNLSAESAATILCAALWMSDVDNWQGAGYSLTEGEIDTISAMVAELQYEVMLESEGGVGDCVKIAEIAASEDVASLALEGFAEGDFHTYKLIIQGMKTNSAVQFVDSVILLINEDDTATKYDFMDFYRNLTQYVRIEQLGNINGFLMWYFASTTLGSGQSVGNCEITFYAPQSDDYKSVHAKGIISGFVTGQMPMLDLNGVYADADPITHIEIFPHEGTLFKVDQLSHLFPSELRMTLYGYK